MLEGKPAGENEAVTMSAIKSILADFEGDFECLQKTPRAASKPANCDAPKIDEASLQPVVEVETKVSSARFTSVPTEASEHAMTRVVAGAMPKRSKETPVVASQRKADHLTEIADVSDEMDVATATVEKNTALKFKLPTLNIAKISGKTSPASFLTAAAIFSALVWPITFGFVVLALLSCVVALFLLVGAERIWASVSWTVAFLAARFPEKRDAIYDGLDSVALRWDGLLDRLPEGLADALYMPDFANYEETQEQHDAIVADRLSRMHNQV